MVYIAFCELRGRVGGPTAVASCSTLARAAPPSSLAHLQPCRQNTTIRSTSSVLQFFRLLTACRFPSDLSHCKGFNRNRQDKRYHGGCDHLPEAFRHGPQSWNNC